MGDSREDSTMVVTLCWKTVIMSGHGTRQSVLIGLGLFSALCGMAVSGFLYSFNAFSDALKDQLLLSQSEVEWISSVANIGSCIGLTAGLFMQRFGPQLTNCTAALISFAGFFLVGASIEKRIPTHFSLMCIYFFIIGQGGIFTYMACMMTTAANFPPKVRGTVIGLVDSMYGGSAAIFSAIYNQTYGKADSPYQQNVAGFFYAGGVITMAVSMFLFATLWWIPWKERQTLDQNDPVRSAASAGIEEPRTDFPLSNGEFKQQQLQRSVQTGNQSAALDGSCDSNNVSSQVEGNAYSPLRRVTSTSSESARSRALQNEGASLLAPTAQEDNNSDLNTLQLFTNGNFQLLFWSFALSTGVGLMFMSNVLFFLKAYRLEVQYRGLFTVLLPICSLVSRFLSGVISDALHVRHISRSMLLLLTISALLVAQILLLIWPQKITVLLVNVVTVGVSYGSMWCLVPTMMTTIGGLKYFGQNWGMVMLSSALLGMGYQALYGKVYDEHVPASTHTPPLVMSSLDGDSPTASTCYGPQCFAITTYTTVASCALSLLFLLVLFVRDQRQLLRRKNQVR